MLIKPLTHLRPLLRLPSHSSPSPEHFSSNPSLLHHLPHNPTASLVSASQSSAQAAGGGAHAGPSGAGSGRSGWGAGTGSGGGYTGQARAFLSLQHNSSLDPSSSLTLNSDDAQRKQGALLFKHRLAKHAQIVQIEGEQTVGRTVHRSIEARSGQRVGIVEMESPSLSADRTIEAQSENGDSSRRRSSIAFPSSQAPSTPPRFASPAGARAIPRTQSSLDLWHVGVARPRELSIRQLSTKSSNVALPDVEELEPPSLVTRDPPPSTRILGQPNRVLMDLAGLDLPGRPARTPLVRRNSTAAMRQSETVPELGAAAADANPADSFRLGRWAENDAKDKVIFKALASAVSHRKENLFRKLANHYRSSRQADAFDVATKNDPELAEYPLPETFSIPTYNVIIDGLLQFRRTGESISPILEVYNELLERDCVPNGNTYGLVIQALCVREQDVWRAAREWDDEKKWSRWKHHRLGVKHDVSAEQEKDEIIAAFKAEGNFESAMKLFAASVLMQGAEYHLAPGPYRYMIQASVAKDPTLEDRQAILDLYAHASALKINGNRAWRGDLFLLQAATNSPDGLEEFWESFRASDEATEFRAYVTWLRRFSRTDDDMNNRSLMEARSEVWVKGAIAHLKIGNVNKAMAIWSALVEASKDESYAGRRPGPPIITDVQSWGAFGVELLKADPAKGAEFWRALSPHVWRNLRLSHILSLVDTLIFKDRFEDLMKLLNTPQVRGRYFKVDRLMVYAIDHATRDKSTRERAIGLVKTHTERHKVPLDIDLVKAWLRVVLGSEQRETLVADAFSAFEVQPVAAQLGPQAEKDFKSMIRSIITSDRLGVRGQLRLLLAAEPFVEMDGDDEVALAVGRNFLQRANLPLPVREVERVFKTVLSYTADDGELDEVLVRMAENMVANKDKFDRIVDRVFFREFERKLVHRLGMDRATELLTPLFGDKAAGRLTKRLPDQAHSTPVTPSSTDAETASEFSLPPLPETAVPLPEYSHELTISYPLSSFIDRHTLKRNAISLDEAYRALMGAMQSQRTVAHPEALSRLFDNLARAGREKEAREIYSLAHYAAANLLPAADRPAAWHHIECYMLIATCHLGLLEEAGMYRARILQAGMAPSAEAYATMIASSKDTTDDALVARELFDESRALGVRPNLFLYNTIISKLSKARKAELALELFKTMKASGIRPSSVTYGAVINACCRVGDGESAEVLFNEMTSQPDFRPRVPPYNTMMQFHLTTQPSRERVLAYHNALVKANVPPSEHTYKLLLDAYAVLPPLNLPAMEKVFDDLCYDRHARVQGTHWASLITAYGLYANDVDKAIATFDGIPSHRQAPVDLRNEPVVWEAILHVVAQKGTVEQMERIKERMVESGAKATAYVYNVLIAGYARAGMIEKAREVFASMGDSITGVAAPNNHPQLKTSSGHAKPSTVTPGPTGVVYREPSTYEAMIRAELSIGNREGAEEVLRMMEARRYPVAVFMRARYLLDDPAMQQAQSAGDLAAANPMLRNESFAPNATDSNRRGSVAYTSADKAEARADEPLVSEQEKAELQQKQQARQEQQ